MSSPQAYRAAPRVWVITSIAFVAMAIFLFGAMVVLGSSVRASLFSPLLLISMLVLILGRLACYRLCVDDYGFEYRDLIGKSFRVNYTDVASLSTKTITMGWLLPTIDATFARWSKDSYKPIPVWAGCLPPLATRNTSHLTVGSSDRGATASVSQGGSR